MQVLSPITLQHPTEKELDIPVEQICRQYRAINLPVERFFEGLDSIELRRCTATGYRFYYPFSIFGDDQFYQDLQSAFPTYYIERWEHTTAMASLQAGMKVLEVGSGTGIFQQMLKKKGISAKGLELNRKAAADCREQGLDVEAAFLQDHVPAHAGAYDAVCSFQVLEHITDVHSYFTSALEGLKRGGKIIIGVPHNNPYIYQHDVHHTLNLPPHHAGLWNRESFEAIPQCFPVTLKQIAIEPLREYKEWYQVQLQWNRQHKPWLAALMSRIPRPVYKFVLRLLKNKIEGRNIIAVFEKL